MLNRYENTQTFVVTSSVLGIGFLLGAVAHWIGWLPLGALAYEPRIIPSALFELLCGVLLLGAAFALRSYRPAAWRNALGAHIVALIGVVLGMTTLSIAYAADTTVSTVYHVVMLGLLLLNTIGLWRLRPRNPLKRAQHEIAARLY
jgi:hypothetical protein